MQFLMISRLARRVVAMSRRLFPVRPLREWITAFCGLVLLACPVSFSGIASGQQPDEASTANQPAETLKRPTLGDVLRKSSADELSRGVQQRESLFLNITGSKKNLQVALVIDGTDSMAQELDSVKKNLAAFAQGVRANKGDQAVTSFALVIYRDADAPSGPVSVVVKNFEDDVDKLDQALKTVKTETGKPYFNELVDVGLHAAMTKLNWMPREKDDEVTRWIILCGDAPPYPAGSRKHTLEELSQLANEKGIEVNGVLCNSGFLKGDPRTAALRKVAVDSLPESRSFLEVLAEKSGGKFLDLWDEETVKKITEDLKAKQRFVKRMNSITEQDVQAYRKEQERLARAAGRNVPQKAVRVAVLPFSAPETMSFRSTSQAARAATEVREQLRRLPGVAVSTPVDVERAYQATRESFSNPQAGVKSLAKQLDVDYVVWCEYNSDGTAAETRFHRTLDGALLAKAKAKSKPSQWTSPSITPEANPQQPAQLPQAFQGPNNYEPFSKTRTAQESLLTALDLMERSLAFRKFDDQQQSLKLLNEAEAHLKRALRHDANNAFAHLLLANCYFNLSRYGETGDYVNLRYEHFRKARELAQSLPQDDPLRIEIEADFALLTDKRFEAAVAGYQLLADPLLPGNSDVALRANWMLAGMYLGDWGIAENPRVAESIMNLDKAREHILRILAFWPDSPQAAFYRKCIDQAERGMMMIDVGKEGK